MKDKKILLKSVRRTIDDIVDKNLKDPDLSVVESVNKMKRELKELFEEECGRRCGQIAKDFMEACDRRMAELKAKLGEK